MIRVFASVCGDLFHVGHLSYLRQSKALGDYMIVGVLTDEAIMAYKRCPIVSFGERVELVKNIKGVDEVVLMDNVDPTELLKKLGNIDIITHSDDWSENFPGAEYMRSIGKQAIRTRYYPRQSTTKIIEKILELAEPVWLCE